MPITIQQTRMIRNVARRRLNWPLLRSSLSIMASFEDDEGSPFSDHSWKTLLADSARARWRAAPATRKDSPIDSAIRSIIRDTVHPKPRVKRATQQMGEIAKGYRRLSDKRHRERAKAMNMRHAKEGDAQQDKRATVITYGPSEALTNLRLRAPANYEITKRVLRESLEFVKPFRPSRILDFGIGCGSASAAALEVFDLEDPDNHVEWIHGVDASKIMREAAERFLNEFIENSNKEQQEKNTPQPNEGVEGHKRKILAPRITLSGHLSADPSLTAEQLSGTMTRAAFDLCLCTFTAAEIPKSSAILAAAALMWEKLRPGGLLVVIEPGTPDGFSNIRSIRNMLLDCCPPEGEADGDEECHVIAPCTHSGHCPLGIYGPHLRTASSLQGTVEHVVPSTDDPEFAQPLSGEESPARIIDVTPNETKKATADETEQGDDYEDDDDDFEFDDNFLLEAEDEDEEEEKLPPGFIEVPFEQQEIFEETIRKKAEVATTRGYCSFVQTFAGRKGEKISYIVLQKRIAGETEVYADGARENRQDVLNGINLSELLSKHIVDDEEEIEYEFSEDESNQRNPTSENDTEKESSANEQELSSHEEALRDMAKRFEESVNQKEKRSSVRGLGLVRDQPESFGRVIRAPRKHRNHILLDCCTDKGLVRHTVTKTLSKKAPGIYQAARKARWGGYWPNSGNKTGKAEPMHARFGEE